MSTESGQRSDGPRIVLATRNAKKLAELRRLLQPQVPGVDVLGLDDLPPYDEPAETEPTFAGNALIKAREAVRVTGLPALADDSGLCVDELAGMPGVLSARWAGRAKDDTANNALLLDQLHDAPDARRGGAFVCAVALVLPDGSEETAHGRVPGRIARVPRGDGGFGYDPLFVPDNESRTMAELSPPEKDAISHRGRALAAILPAVAAALGPVP